MEPVVQALRDKYKNDVVFIIADLKDLQAQEMAYQFGVRSIPAFFFLNSKGELIHQLVGIQSKTTLEEGIRSIMAN